MHDRGKRFELAPPHLNIVLCLAVFNGISFRLNVLNNLSFTSSSSLSELNNKLYKLNREGERGGGGGKVPHAAHFITANYNLYWNKYKIR